MQRTRGEAINEFLGFVGELDDALAQQLARAELLNAILIITQSHVWLDYRSPAPFELSLVVNQRSYALPDYFGRLEYFRLPNLSTCGHIQVIAKEDADRQFSRAGTSQEVASRSKFAVLAGITGVQTQPASTGEALEVVSTSASDVDTVVVSIAGNDGNGVWTRAQITLNGTGAVAAGTWNYIDEFGKSYVDVGGQASTFLTSHGTVTLRKASAGATLQALLPQESAREHQVITFYPKPLYADIISIPFVRQPKRPLYDSDPLPKDWWPALMERMLIRWRMNTGELGLDNNVPTPELNRLIENDNIKRPAPRIHPFTG